MNDIWPRRGDLIAYQLVIIIICRLLAWRWISQLQCCMPMTFSQEIVRAASACSTLTGSRTHCWNCRTVAGSTTLRALTSGSTLSTWLCLHWPYPSFYNALWWCYVVICLRYLLQAFSLRNISRWVNAELFYQPLKWILWRWPRWRQKYFSLASDTQQFFGFAHIGPRNSTGDNYGNSWSRILPLLTPSQ